MSDSGLLGPRKRRMVGSISAMEIGSLGSVTFPLSSGLHRFDNLTSANELWLDGGL